MSWLKSFMRDKTVGRSLRLLAPKDRRKLGLVVAIQIFLSGLDLFGVALIGVVSALAITGVSGQVTGNRVGAVLEFMQLDGYTFEAQVAILGATAGVTLIGRTLLSIFFIRKSLFFLAHKAAVISGDLTSRVLAQPLLQLQKRTSQDTLYALTEGVRSLTISILGSVVILASDLSLVLVMAIGLLVVDPGTAIGSFVFFTIIAVFLYRLSSARVRFLNSSIAETTIRGNEKIIEVLTNYRESIVRNRRAYYAKEFAKNRLDYSRFLAENAFIPNISKYVLESSVVIGAILLSATQFILQDSRHAVATLAIFLAAGTRVAPAILRIQQGLLQIKGASGQADLTLKLAQEVENFSIAPDTNPALAMENHVNFSADVTFRNVTFSYPDGKNKILDQVSIRISPGQFVAFVGSSGAGKSTMVDLLLGVLLPDSGDVKISGQAPSIAIEQSPGAIAYVPQDVSIAIGTVRENIAIGFPKEFATDERINKTLKIAHLDSFVDSLENKADTQVGERGAKLSGGQRQRLGIARAMFTNPKLLVLDEATSSLDAETEASVSAAIQALRGGTTIFMIAHRLATIRSADLVVYIADGQILAQGTFAEVRAAVPEFDKQANLLGL
jgi:ABC-type multidrug transport system fused ATPase/permease subunit